ncbi:hypothetical protein FRC06_009127, partial [Ceratobasidium sp. 370]
MLVLRTALCTREPVTLNTVAGLLKLDFDHLAHTVLHPLLPVLHVSNAGEMEIAMYDSFASYLLDPQRSGKFCCDIQRDNALLAQLCFAAVGAANPSFNVCNLGSSYLLDREVAGVDERANESISEAMWYASRHWATHLKLAGPSEELLTCLQNFLSRRLLLWMEVMNLKHHISGAVELLRGVHTWLQEVECLTTIRDLILDAWKFVAEFSSNVVSESTPHIYISALRFWPAHRPVATHYIPMLRNVMKVMGLKLGICGEDPSISDGLVTRIVGSPQGFNIISGATGDNLHPAPVGIGKPVDQPVGGHTDVVFSVAYSPDGAYIASSSWDETIRIWDAQTGKPVGQPLNGHTSTISSVAYSPDGAYIASGSWDKTVRIWNAHTGQLVGQPLSGHTDWVRSVAYSPDGAYVASGSDDKTVRIWDAYTGQPMGQPLNGHTGCVSSVVYSPNGSHIASGSWDKTTRVWDAQTGRLVCQPLSGHTDGVGSVVYSPNNAYIVSDSDDMTVRIWDPITGHPVGQPLNGHAGKVSSVVYSPDGSHIASGSWDKTIRIWDTHVSESLLQPGRSDAYSPNRPLIPSAFARYFTRTSRKSRLAITSSHVLTAKQLLHRVLMDDEGWAVNAYQERLIWVPLDLREFIELPPTVTVIPI